MCTHRLAALGVLLTTLSLGAAEPARAVKQKPAAGGQLAEIRSFLADGRYGEAEAAARSLVAALDAAHGADSIELAPAADLLVDALLRNGRAGQAATKSLAERVVAIRDRSGPPANADLPRSLSNLARVSMELDDYGDAVALLERALALHERSGEGDPAAADILDELGTALAFSSRIREGTAALERALGIKEERFGKQHVEVARTLERLAAVLLRRQLNYTASRPLLERAIAIREASGPDHPELAAVIDLWGLQLWFDGDLSGSREAHLRALSIAGKFLRPDHPSVAVSLKNLAVTLSDLGDLPQAKTFQEQALEIAKENWGPAHSKLAAYLNDLGISNRLMGDYATALLLNERALEIREAKFGPNDQSVATIVHNRALLHVRLGDFETARQEYSRAVEIWRQTLGPEHEIVGRALRQLAVVYGEVGRDREALPMFERALAIQEQRLGKDHRDVAFTLSQYALALERQNQLPRALEMSARSVSIWERSQTVDAFEFSRSLAVNGDLLSQAGNLRAARGYYDRSLAIKQTVVGPSHPSYADTQVRLASVVARLGDERAALDLALAGDETGRAHLRLTQRYLSERQALEYAATRFKGADLALSLISERPAPEDTDERLWDAVVRGRAVILDEMAGRRRATTDDDRPDLQPLWNDLATARRRLANLVVRGVTERRPGQYAALIAQTRGDKERAERELTEKSAAFREELAQTEIGFERVRAALPAGSALLSFVHFDRTVLADTAPAPSRAPLKATGGPAPARVPSYAAFLIRSGDAQPIAVQLGDAKAIDDLVASWRKEAVAGLARSAASPRAAERALRISGAQLRQLIWDPIEKHLGDVSRVFVVPDGALNLIPLAALPIGQTGYLVEKGPVLHYLTAERDLVRADRANNLGQGLLAVGGPSFDDASLFAALAKPRPAQTPASAQVRLQALATPAAFRGRTPDCASFQSLRFDMLPASSREANDVANLWKKSGGGAADATLTTVLDGHAADEYTFKQRAPGQRVLHLATHGFFLGSVCAPPIEGTRAVGGLVPRQKIARTIPRNVTPTRPATNENPLLFSGLAMAGANRRAAAGADEDDGILTAEEVASMNLSGVEWAVLSACDTGLGEIKAGEGVFGLRRAFQVAGAHTVIMSLWSVEDRSAMEWMRALYEGRLRQGLDTADAVRDASLTVLGQRRARGQSLHPFYWAGFVASGDWR
jgi:CHAT domain-containing protein/tetratricopeptide (TPR) repeat protein